MLPAIAFAAATDSDDVPTPTLRARWTEDWSVLRDAARPDGTSSVLFDSFWRPIKHLPLNESASAYLTLGGEARLAYELYDEVDAGLSGVGTQDVEQLRAAVFGDLRLTPKWRVFGELGYAKAHDRDGGPKTIDETELDLWQLFVDCEFTLGNGERLIARAGRQMIETANVFITAGEAHNIRLVYDGLRIAIPRGTETVFDAFYAEYVDYADGTFDMSGTGEYFWGTKVGRRFSETGVDMNVLYLGWDLKDRQFQQGGGNRYDERRHHLMLWLKRDLTTGRRWGFDYYVVHQFGKYEEPSGDSDIDAWAGFGGFQYALSDAANPPIVGLKTGYFSGDDDPDDDELNTFYDHVFGTPYFGYARDIMPFNLIHLQPNISYRLGRVGLTLSHDLLWRAETRDAYYNNANGFLVAADESDSDWLGQQTQLALRFRPRPGLILSAHLARLFAGDVIEDAGGTDRTYFYVGLNYLF
jgi:hypothetical protein